jgi:proline racemase
MAILAATGQLDIGETFVNQGLVGTLYTGRLLRGCSVPGGNGVVPQVQGSAWLTGRATLWRDPHDPLGEGFLV